MKRSERQSSTLSILAVITAITLVIPNILLAFADRQSIIAGFLSVTFPFAAYLLIISLWKRTGYGVLCTLPLMVFGAFQIVLLYLYGEAIIAVDMFINVVTTDVQEATTLLEQLMPAIIAVIILYLPPLAWAVISLCGKRSTINHYRRLLLVHWSLISLVITGIILLICSLTHLVTPGNDIFPINVIRNIAIATQRVREASHYPESAEDYTFNATMRSDAAADTTGRIIIAVIGETARADRWSLYGFDRLTNPRLAERDGLIVFKKSISQSNTTHKSVPMMITALNAETFNQLPKTKSFITAFKEAGYSTAYFSNQPPNGSYNQHLGEEADTTFFFERKIGVKEKDSELARLTAQWLEHDTASHQLIVLHTYGNHFPYTDHYSKEQAVFTPDTPLAAESSNRPSLCNAYDNSTIAVDLALDSLISIITAQKRPGALIYAADHGEDLFDDTRHKFLHASPIPTAWQLYVPMIIWTTPDLLPRKSLQNLQNNADVIQSPSETFFHTTLDLGGISTPLFRTDLSLISDSIASHPLIYLTDRNQAVQLSESGMRDTDMDTLSKWGIK